MTKIIACILALALAPALSSGARADLLKTILDKGVVRIGVPYDIPPYGFLDGNGAPTGYAIDVANRLAKGLGVKAELQQVTSANRIAFLTTGRVDIVVTNIAATPERATQVMFSSPYVNSVLGVFGPKSKEVDGIEGLRKYRIAVTKGTAPDTILSDVNPKLNILRAEDEPTANMMYVTGQADFWATASIGAASVSAANPSTEYELKLTLRESPSHIAVPMGETNLLRWVDTFIFTQRLNGQLDQLSQKYLKAPLGDLKTF